MFKELFLKFSQSFAKPFLVSSCFSEMFKKHRPTKEVEAVEAYVDLEIVKTLGLDVALQYVHSDRCHLSAEFDLLSSRNPKIFFQV